MKFAILFCLAVSYAGTQTMYEAEASVNQLSGSADAAGCSVCSGRRNVQNLGGPGHGAVQINGVSSQQAGKYAVTVTYDNGTSGNMPASVIVNGATQATISFPPTGSWTRLANQNVSVTLRAGSNSVKFASASGSNWVAEIDKISVPNTGTVAPPPPVEPPPPPPPVEPPPPVQPPPPPPSGNHVSLTSYGSVGHGGNDTAVFQSALNQSAANKEVLEIPAGTYNVSPLSFPNGASVIMDAGATVEATSGYSKYQHMLNVVDVSNVSIVGTPGQSIFKMRKSEYTSGEYRHCLSIEGASNVSVSGIECNDSGGDGLYIGAGSRGYSDTVSVINSTFNNNRRNAFSLISGKNITVDDCHFTNTSGTLPQAGIDIEPNGDSDVLQNVRIQDSTASGNAGNGLTVGLSAQSTRAAAVSIVISGFATSHNADSGYQASDNSNGSPGGSVAIENSSSSFDGLYGADAHFWDIPGPALALANISVTNANQRGSTDDDAAIGIEQGGGGGRLGNVQITGASITDTTHKLATYFAIENYSGTALSNIHITSPGPLTGAPAGAPFAIVNGQAVSSVNIN